MPRSDIVIRGAKEHNLKNITITIPRDKLVVFTGVSGSGKSSLAFDTLYAEGQRRYVESLSAYARQFLDQMQKPNVEHIDGLSPAISIEQKSTSKNPRSTVGTVTEIHDFMRVLWARIGEQYCYRCGDKITTQTVDQMVDRLQELAEGTRIQVLAPVVRERKGEYKDIFDQARRDGFARARVNGEVVDLSEEIRLDKRRKHNIEIVVDRIVIRSAAADAATGRGRLAEAMEIAVNLARGLALVEIANSQEPIAKGQGSGVRGQGSGKAQNPKSKIPNPESRIPNSEILFSQHAACLRCGISYGELEPQMFSFNSPQGMCPVCNGVGSSMAMDEGQLVTDPERPLREGAIELLGNPETQHTKHILEALERNFGIDLDVPFEQLPEGHREIMLRGYPQDIEFRFITRNGYVYKYRGRWEGVAARLERRLAQSEDEEEMTTYHRLLAQMPCPACQGGRLRAESAAVRIGGRSIVEVSRMSIAQAHGFFGELPGRLGPRERTISERVVKEVLARLTFMLDVGLGYLTIDRSAPTLSGGEAQRIRLATQIGSGLMGVLYILDEPSIGLHARDNIRLLQTLKRLRDLGNTVIVVEHDEETILNADHVVDFGPGAGVNGGEIVVAGTVGDVKRCPDSLTGQYLAGRLQIPVPSHRRPPRDQWLIIRGAAENNLKEIDVAFPLGTFACVTGVSGSGKSTLVAEVLYRALMRQIYGSRTRPGRFHRLEGLQHIDKVINIDQDPIGRTPRSNPATYVGVFTPIREFFAQLPEARLRGYKPGRFSFNIKGGRCEACEGDGVKKIEMLFLPDVYVTCEGCKGSRFNRETLQVRYKGKSIADVLNMTIDEAYELFKNIPRIARLLETIRAVGLGYVQLGQPAPTLSGGEAQRVKLARELSKRQTGRTVYILDEPTTGLHFADTEKLLGVLHRLTDSGNTVIVIEHNMEVIKTADYIIDLGPEGGEEGGWIVCTGTPEEVAECPASYTGQFLRAILNGKRIRRVA